MCQSPLIERFMSEVTVTSDGCWMWAGRRTEDGYGLFQLAGRCLRGHLLEGDNVYLNAGRRHCRECTRIRARKNQAVARRAAGIPIRKAVA